MDDVEALLGLEPLREGDRVRIRLSGECRMCCGSYREFRVEDGIEGIVIPCPYGHDAAVVRDPGYERYRHVHLPGHDYSVRFTPPLHSPRYGQVIGGCFARSELSRL